MTRQTLSSPHHAPISRRTLMKAAAVAATAIVGAATTPRMELAAAPNNLAGTLTGPVAAPQSGVTTMQTTPQAAPPNQGTPPSVITNPPRQWGPDAPPTIYPDPDIIIIDPSFGPYMLGITAIHRLWTGGHWLEGPAWSSEGNFLLFSDVQADVEYRLIWDDMRVTKFRDPSFHANGHTRDFQGREITCQDELRRVVRWEHDGTMTVIADNYQGQEAQLAQRRCSASRWQPLVHRPPLWRHTFRRAAGRAGRPGQPDGACQPESRRPFRR